MDTCIFCDNAANSKEDLFSNWILDRVETRYPLYRERRGKPAELTVSQKVKLKCVCKPCNNGWMSQIENDCVRVMGNLLEDIQLPLDEEYQQLISRWAILKSMINDTVEEHERFFTRTECVNFKEKGEFPLAIQVCSACFT
jgi:hypothetical protein